MQKCFLQISMRSFKNAIDFSLLRYSLEHSGKWMQMGEKKQYAVYMKGKKFKLAADGNLILVYQ